MSSPFDGRTEAQAMRDFVAFLATRSEDQNEDPRQLILGRAAAFTSFQKMANDLLDRFPCARACNNFDDLVAALREIVAKVGDREGMGDLGGSADAYLRAIREVARAAIAKVEA